MVRLYTPKQRSDVLKLLSIKPVNGLVDGREAAAILTWRAQEEYKVTHQYEPRALIRHVEQKNIKPVVSGTRSNNRATKNFYPVAKVFELPISPTRGRTIEQ